MTAPNLAIFTPRPVHTDEAWTVVEFGGRAAQDRILRVDGQFHSAPCLVPIALYTASDVAHNGLTACPNKRQGAFYDVSLARVSSFHSGTAAFVE